MSSKPTWKMPSDDWVQDDEKKRFFLLNRATGTIKANQMGLDLITGAKWHSSGESECGGFFPQEFRHCPYCGKTLAQSEHQGDVWMPPFGGGSGLRLLQKPINVASIPTKKENTLRWIDQEQDTFSLPRPRGDYEFIVGSLGTKSPLLITFDRTTGLLDYFCPAKNKWTSFIPAPGRRVGESKLPNWSWSAAFINEKAGLAVPTSEGPVWIALDWTNGTCFPSFGQGEAIGGPATLDNQIFIPVLVGGSIAAIHSFDFVALKWNQIGEPVLNWVGDSGNARYFSVPIVDEDRYVVYWVGTGGLLTFDLTKHTCGWRPWETDAYPCRAVPELGPPYHDHDGYFWQICYDEHDNAEGREAFRYYKLSGDESDRETVDGGRFSSGISCFSRLFEFWDKPWARVDANRQDKAEFIRVPLLSLDDISKATITAKFGFGSTVPLLELVRNRGETYHIELQIESPGDLPIKLRMPYAFNVHTPWELRLFIYQQYLYVYTSEEVVCYKWRFK